jgi:hypothetical protein
MGVGEILCPPRSGARKENNGDGNSMIYRQNHSAKNFQDFILTLKSFFKLACFIGNHFPALTLLQNFAKIP